MSLNKCQNPSCGFHLTWIEENELLFCPHCGFRAKTTLRARRRPPVLTTTDPVIAFGSGYSPENRYLTSDQLILSGLFLSRKEVALKLPTILNTKKLDAEDKLYYIIIEIKASSDLQIIIDDERDKSLIRERNPHGTLANLCNLSTKDNTAAYKFIIPDAVRILKYAIKDLKTNKWSKEFSFVKSSDIKIPVFTNENLYAKYNSIIRFQYALVNSISELELPFDMKIRYTEQMVKIHSQLTKVGEKLFESLLLSRRSKNKPNKRIG